MLTPAQTAAAPESIFPIREREDHMDEALAALQTALIFTADPIARRQIENARAHLAAFNAWPVENAEREADHVG